MFAICNTSLVTQRLKGNTNAQRKEFFWDKRVFEMCLYVMNNSSHGDCNVCDWYRYILMRFTYQSVELTPFDLLICKLQSKLLNKVPICRAVFQNQPFHFLSDVCLSDQKTLLQTLLTHNGTSVSASHCPLHFLVAGENVNVKTSLVKIERNYVTMYS